MLQSPTAIALSLCEQIIVEENTHNVTLVNCFTRLWVGELSSSSPLIVFVSLTDGIGDGTLTLVVLRPDTLEEIFTRDQRIVFHDPLQEMRIAFRLSLAFPIEGRYQVNLLVDGNVIGQRLFKVALAEE